MANCDDEFSLLGDDAQSPQQQQQQQQEVHHHHHHQQQQSQQQQKQLAVPFSHRYIAAAAAGLAAAVAASAGKGGVPIHSRLNNNAAAASTTSPKKGSEASYTEAAFAQSDANNHRHHFHCFVPEEEDHTSFAPPSSQQGQGQGQEEEEEGEEEEDNDDDEEGDHRSREDEAAGAHGHHSLPSSSRHHHLLQQQRQLQLVDPKRKDREELSDGESPSIYYSGNINTNNNNKKLRPAAAAVPSSSSGDYRKDREEWSDSAIGCLLDAYTEKYIQLNRGNLRGRDWEDVATIVSERCDKHKSGKSVEQCKNKVDNLKKRYKVECQRLTSGSLAVSHWPWFKKMEQIVGTSSSSSNKPPIIDDDKSTGPIGASTPTSRQLKRYPVAPPGSASPSNSFKMKSVSNPRWKRALLKISGSALSGTGPQNVDPKVIMLIAREVAMASRVGVEVAIVVGGRNFFCGDTWVATTGTDRAAAYQIGLMASAMNSLLLQASLEKIGIETRVQTAFMMQEIAEPYIRRRAIRHLEKGRVVIFGGVSGGVGNPLLTTDTSAALRASEINADVLLKGTNMDGGGYECHPRGNGIGFEHISYKEVDSRCFSAMDMTAITFCAENNIPVVFFNLLEPGNISRALCGDQVGTLVDQSGRI